MSTLTKILVVLLTLFSIFLCGIVVTYVANADNYKDKYTKLKSDKDALDRKAASLTEDLEKKTAERDALEKRLQGDVTTAQSKLNEVQAKLSDAEREKARMLEQVNNFTAVTKDFSVTNEKQRQMLDETQAALKKAQAELVELNKKLDEVTAALVERNAIVDTLETEKRRLVEEKAGLQNKLDDMLRGGGRVATVTPVTPERATARPAQPTVASIGLKGQISGVDLKNSWASVSLGSADGVKEGMRFHVTRGDQFICDVLIISVDTEKAVGVLELLQQPPKVGDSVATNL